MFNLTPKPLPADVQAVLDTASLLEVTEFHLFELAFVDWFGRRGGTTEVEPFFANYMFQGIVPLWVRQFTRKVAEQLTEQRPLDCQLPLARGEAPAPSVYKAAIYTALVVGAMATMIVLSMTLPNLSPFVEGCYFPPCY